MCETNNKLDHATNMQVNVQSCGMSRSMDFPHVKLAKYILHIYWPLQTQNWPYLPLSAHELLTVAMLLLLRSQALAACNIGADLA